MCVCARACVHLRRTSGLEDLPSQTWNFVCVACVKEQPLFSVLCWQRPWAGSLRAGETRLHCAWNWLEFSSKSLNISGHLEQMVQRPLTFKIL